MPDSVQKHTIILILEWLHHNVFNIEKCHIRQAHDKLLSLQSIVLRCKILPVQQFGWRLHFISNAE